MLINRNPKQMQHYSPAYITIASLLLIFTISCNGQSNIPPQDVVNEYEHIGGKMPKIKKTQGANEYQNIHCGLQDKSGNLWFGTTGEGVYRYDGKQFTQYTVKDGLSSNIVWAILQDTKGYIWLGTDAGICRYDGKTISIVSITTTGGIGWRPGNPSLNNPSTKNTVWSILQDKNGTIWFGTDEGLYCYNGNNFIHLLDNPGIVNNSNVTLKSIQCMLEDTKGRIWFGSGPMAFEGICRLSGTTIENFRPKNETWIRNIIEDNNGNIWFATRHFGACRYDGHSFSYINQSQEMENGTMMACLHDRKGNTWFASDYGAELNDTVGGVWRYDGTSVVKYSTKDGLVNNAVFFILEDRDGNIWVGTRNIGLYRFNGKTFDNFSE